MQFASVSLNYFTPLQHKINQYNVGFISRQSVLYNTDFVQNYYLALGNAKRALENACKCVFQILIFLKYFKAFL